MFSKGKKCDPYRSPYTTSFPNQAHEKLYLTSRAHGEGKLCTYRIRSVSWGLRVLDLFGWDVFMLPGLGAGFVMADRCHVRDPIGFRVPSTLNPTKSLARPYSLMLNREWGNGSQ